MGYTQDGLISVNASYHYEHRVTLSDVERANQLVQAIEATRNTMAPQAGDIVQYTDRHGNYYARAHIEGDNGDGKLAVCEHPSEPWVTVRDGRISTNTSGGAWAAIPANLELVGMAQKYFVHWGHCGPCGNGAFSVGAQVNVWRYTEGNPEFSTEHHDKFWVTYSEEPVGCGYHYIVTRGASTPYRGFRTDTEYRAWLEQYQGVERPAAWPNQTIVWTRKH